MLQHVLRPPQQRRETNPAVYRPLAPPSAAPAHLLLYLRRPKTLLLPHHLRSHDESTTAKEKERQTWADGQRKGNGAKRDGHALTHNSPVST